MGLRTFMLPVAIVCTVRVRTTLYGWAVCTPDGLQFLSEVGVLGSLVVFYLTHFKPHFMVVNHRHAKVNFNTFESERARGLENERRYALCPMAGAKCTASDGLVCVILR